MSAVSNNDISPCSPRCCNPGIKSAAGVLGRAAEILGARQRFGLQRFFSETAAFRYRPLTCNRATKNLQRISIFASVVFFRCRCPGIYSAAIFCPPPMGRDDKITKNYVTSMVRINIRPVPYSNSQIRSLFASTLVHSQPVDSDDGMAEASRKIHRPYPRSENGK